MDFTPAAMALLATTQKITRGKNKRRQKITRALGPRYCIQVPEI
jgi:hypothetical protein